MLEITTTTAILIVVLVVLVLLIITGCKLKCKKLDRDNYTRTCLTDSTNCRFVRTPVDYAMKDPAGWQSNPHWVANPRDELQPLEYGPIDFYPDERKLWDQKQLWTQYGNNYVAGTKKPFIVNDNKTRTLLREVGDEGVRRILDNMTGPQYGPGGPPETELTLSPGARYPENEPYYGGPSFFIHNDIGE